LRNRFNKNVPDANQNYFNLLPSARIQVADLSLNYSTSVSLPSIYNIQPITIRNTQLYTFTGNPSLVPSRTHNFSMGFNKYYSKSDLFIYSNGNASFDENSVVTQSQISPEGATVSMPVNRDGRRTLNLSFGLSKKFKTAKTWQIRANPYVSFYQSRSYIILNQNEGLQNNTYTSLGLYMTIGWKDKVELTPHYAINPQFTTYDRVNFQSVNYTAHSGGTSYTIRWPKRIYVEGNYTYSYNPLVSQGFPKSSNLLNVSIALQMLKKDRGELKLSCYDLLDQNINTYRYASTNAIADIQNQILKRYFLLTYMIKFNKTTTK
jgi:hypothetical protein